MKSDSRNGIPFSRVSTAYRAYVLSSLVTVFVVAISGCQDVAAKDKRIAELEDELKKSEEKIRVLEQSVARLGREAERKSLAEATSSTRAPVPDPKAVEEATSALGVKPGEKMFAVFETNLGKMVAELYWDRVPNTVMNFVLLAEGKKEWTDPKTNEKTKRPLYNGTIFHRVIPKFMIQGGDPLGTGQGGPGYKFADEIHTDLRHDAPGILSMANAGPNTNGSQFFITEVPTPHLNGRHSVFGKLISGLDVQLKIATAENRGSRPTTDIVLKSLKIHRGTTPPKG